MWTLVVVAAAAAGAVVVEVYQSTEVAGTLSRVGRRSQSHLRGQTIAPMGITHSS